jgi:hypothetical protein
MNDQQTVLIRTGAAAADAEAAFAAANAVGAPPAGPVLLALLVLALSCTLVVVGVNILFGAGWSFIAAGALLLVAALRMLGSLKRGE